jgi:hypothetical protein
VVIAALSCAWGLERDLEAIGLGRQIPASALERMVVEANA